MNIAVIPARGGSTRIPGKNIKSFLGKPLIAYSIEAALQSKLFDQVIVSTDSQDIAEVARKYGADVPFMRPANLGENHVNVSDVMHYTITRLMESGQTIEVACCIVATAPFLTPNALSTGYDMIKNHPVDTVMSVTRFPFPIQRAFYKDEEGRMKLVQPEHEFTHSNNLPESYHDAAQFYFLNTEKFLKSNSLLGREVLPVILPNFLVRDIDTPEDWDTAEIMYAACKERGHL